MNGATDGIVDGRDEVMEIDDADLGETVVNVDGLATDGDRVNLMASSLFSSAVLDGVPIEGEFEFNLGDQLIFPNVGDQFESSKLDSLVIFCKFSMLSYFLRSLSFK